MLKTKIKNIFVALVVVGMVFIVKSSGAAGQGVLSIKPANGGKVKDSTFTSTIYADGKGEPIAGVNVIVNYNTSQLQFLSLDTSVGSWKTCPQPSGSNGTITISCAELGGSVSGENPVATISFKVLASQGNTVLTFGDNSKMSAVDRSNVWNTNTTGATYSLSAPVTPPTTGGGGGGSGGGTSSGGSGGGTSSGGTSSGGSSKPATGTTKKPTTSAPAASAPAAATPTIPAGSEVAPTAITNTLVAIYVTDKEGNAVAGAKVWIDDQQALTDALGIATFTDISAGKYKVKVDSKDGVASQEIVVGNGGDDGALRVDLKVKPKTNILLFVGLAVILILLAVLATLAKRMHYKKKEASRRFGGMRATVSDMSKKPSTPNDTVATVITPKADDEEESLGSRKPDLIPSDTLSEIERKVGAKKASHQDVSNDFEPNLIQSKKVTKP